MELEDKIYDELTAICEKGNVFADNEEYESALECFNEALKLLPQPYDEWEAATWIYASIGDMLYFMEDYEKCLDNFMEAMKCPDGLGNPFIYLRIGECFYHLGNMDKAKDFLLRAYMLEGEEIFKNDDGDAFYFKVIEDIV